MYQSAPFQVSPLIGNGRDDEILDDGFPAAYLQPRTAGGFSHMKTASDHVRGFLTEELSLGKLDKLLPHLWFAGAHRPTEALHQHIMIGRQIVVTERMDLHLVWTSDDRLFVKPLPAFLLKPEVWSAHLTCDNSCSCLLGGPQFCEAAQMNRCALGLLYSYACLIRYPSDFAIARERNLLPADAASWVKWKETVRNILRNYDRSKIHPRFQRGELRLGRLNTIHRLTQLPPFESYMRTYRSYGGLFQENLTW